MGLPQQVDSKLLFTLVSTSSVGSGLGMGSVGSCSVGNCGCEEKQEAVPSSGLGEY